MTVRTLQSGREFSQTNTSRRLRVKYWHDKHARQYMANVAQRKKGAVAILLRANITFRRKRRKLTYTSRCCRHANKSADLWFVYRISRVSRYSAVRAVDERSVKGIKRVSERYSHRHAIISLSSRPTCSVYPHCTMSESNSFINSSLIFIAEHLKYCHRQV